ncbi:MAG: surf-like protein [Thelocarpon superellum]|nr:MAG: surf-like protein [Thelocarpon superellum]
MNSLPRLVCRARPRPSSPRLLNSGTTYASPVRCTPRLQRRDAHTPADDPAFSSIVDNPPNLIRTGKRHGPGIIILAIIPITAFALGTWQVQRLGWKTDLIARFEDRLVRDPLPLPPRIDPSAVAEFDYRRVEATGRFRHDQEMLIGPRIHDGENGYLVITPLEREGGTTVLVNRGWIQKRFKRQQDRRDALPTDEVVVRGLLREPWKKNMFTPDNRPETHEYYFPDVAQMARLTGSQPVWIEETMTPDLLSAYDREAKGIPIGRPAEVNLRNNHSQYALSAATAIMLWMVVRRPPSEVARKVRQNKEW